MLFLNRSKITRASNQPHQDRIGYVGLVGTSTRVSLYVRMYRQQAKYPPVPPSLPLPARLRSTSTGRQKDYVVQVSALCGRTDARSIGKVFGRGVLT